MRAGNGSSREKREHRFDSLFKYIYIFKVLKVTYRVQNRTAKLVCTRGSTAPTFNTYKTGLFKKTTYIWERITGKEHIWLSETRILWWLKHRLEKLCTGNDLSYSNTHTHTHQHEHQFV